MATITLDSGVTLQVADVLFGFMRDEALPGSKWTPEEVFRSLGRLVEEFEPRNRELLAKRDEAQQRIDAFYIAKRTGGWRPTRESADTDALELERFLVEIGCLDTEPDAGFTMTTPQLDPEMDQNGPELVTPVTNASMAVGGANARWGSLYDAYYLSDIHPEIDRQTQQPARLRIVVEETNRFLDQHVAQWDGGAIFDDIISYKVVPNSQGRRELRGVNSAGEEFGLRDPEKFVGFNLDEDGQPAEFFLANNGLKIQFQLYEGGRVHPEIGQFKDLVVESAVTNIVDFEDAVAIVDAEDMVAGLRNYLGLMRGDLHAYGSRGNLKTINSDKTCLDVLGNPQTFKATSLMSVRNVSLHMYTGMVQLEGQDIPERILGVFLTTLITSLHDKGSNGEGRPAGRGEGAMPARGPNSSRGYIYQVTPKLQTREEVAEQVRFFEAVEAALGLPNGVILIGIMNEELGMTLQLAEALRAAQSRVFFINTGFLDRTGSQIRVQMQAGPVDLRDDLTRETFNTSYELHNVDVGIRAGVHTHGKIGKGMQVRNRAMDEMLERKIDQPRTGGNTAWVPAPYPSDIHAMHYHMVDVDQVQRTMEDSPALNIPRRALLTFPLLDQDKLHAPGTKRDLLLRYLHSMMAYVAPWVHQGIGCTGVLNFDQIEEMKDRATERIDSALIANWKLFNVITQEDIENAVRETAGIVDEQNANNPAHIAMTDTKEKRDNLMKDPAVMAVLQIIEEALSSTSAYVEPALFRNRRTFKTTRG